MARNFTAYADRFSDNLAEYLEVVNSSPDVRFTEFKQLTDYSRLDLPVNILEVPTEGGVIDLIFPGSNVVKADFVNVDKLQNAEVVYTDWDLTGLPSDYFDGVLSIVPIHHADLDQKLKYISGVYRVLKSGGMLAFAEVEKNSKISRFLDEFVDEFSPGGHKGAYVSKHFLAVLRKAGFIDVSSKVAPCHWTFNTRAELLNYITKLFKIRCSNNKLLDYLSSIVGISEYENKVFLHWELRYFRGKKIDQIANEAPRTPGSTEHSEFFKEIKKI